MLIFYKAYIPSLHSALGTFLPLITVNCIILGRAEVLHQKTASEVNS